MTNRNIPNTKIKIGELKISDLEKISKAYIDCGLNIHGKKIKVNVDSINKDNLSLRQFELTPNPFGEANNKIIFDPRYCRDGNLYVNIKMINDYNLQEKFDKKLKDYLLYKMENGK